MENTKTVNAFGQEFAVLRESGVVKGRDGWETKTRIDLGVDGKGKKRVLELDTGKPHRRQDKAFGATTTGTLFIDSGDGFLSLALMQDFCQTVHRGEPGRCTEKAVRACHAAAMDNVDWIIQSVVSYYVDRGESVAWGTVTPKVAEAA